MGREEHGEGDTVRKPWALIAQNNNEEKKKVAQSHKF